MHRLNLRSLSFCFRLRLSRGRLGALDLLLQTLDLLLVLLVSFLVVLNRLLVLVPEFFELIQPLPLFDHELFELLEILVRYISGFRCGNRREQTRERQRDTEISLEFHETPSLSAHLPLSSCK